MQLLINDVSNLGAKLPLFKIFLTPLLKHTAVHERLIVLWINIRVKHCFPVSIRILENVPCKYLTSSNKTLSSGCVYQGFDCWNSTAQTRNVVRDSVECRVHVHDVMQQEQMCVYTCGNTQYMCQCVCLSDTRHVQLKCCSELLTGECIGSS